MLVLSRKLNETIVIDGNVRITVVGVRGSQVRLGIEAPDRMPILREELLGPVRPDGHASAPGAIPASGGLADRAARPVPASPASRL